MVSLTTPSACTSASSSRSPSPTPTLLDAPTSSLPITLQAWATSTTTPYPFFDIDSLSTHHHHHNNHNPPASASSDLSRWLAFIESGCADRDIPQSQWTDAAIFFLTGELREVMCARRGVYLKEVGEGYWEWEEFKKDLVGIVGKAEEIKKTPHPTTSEIFADFQRDHPYAVAAAGLGLVIGGSVVVLPAVGLAVLNAVGFGAGGVVGGSLAASLQSLIYGPLTTGIFSSLQSFAATAVAASVPAVAAAGTALVAGAGSLVFGAGAANDRGGDDRPRSPPPPWDYWGRRRDDESGRH